MPAKRPIADICKTLAESAAHQGHMLLAHLLNVATLEAESKQATFHETA